MLRFISDFIDMKSRDACVAAGHCIACGLPIENWFEINRHLHAERPQSSDLQNDMCREIMDEYLKKWDACIPSRKVIIAIRWHEQREKRWQRIFRFFDWLKSLL